MQASLALAFKVCRFMELLVEFMMVEYCSQWKTNGMKFESSKARWITSFFKVLFYIVSSNLPSLECLLSHHSYLESVNKLSLHKASSWGGKYLFKFKFICINSWHWSFIKPGCLQRFITNSFYNQTSNIFHFKKKIISAEVITHCVTRVISNRPH